MTRAALLIAILALTGGCEGQDPPRADTYRAPPPTDTYRNYNPVSLLLKPGMTEDQVNEIAGQPIKSELSTCGHQLNKLWTCKIVLYGSSVSRSEEPHSGMSIVFAQRASGEWVVNSWKVL
jgi:hypothetical protein